MGEVIQIGEWTLRRTQELRWTKEDGCKHHRLELDDRGDVVKCSDCGVQVSAYWALTTIVERYNQEMNKLSSAREQLKKEQQEGVSLTAARKVEKAWRSRTMVPACPHCHTAIFPGDGFGGINVNKEMALRRREVASCRKTAARKGAE
ncbi:hypothetical protein DK842_17735 [Chromobacterium phragmitis]|uniref:hypothetical protein n=1 Tax=Chromobacterium phragmitis TaxID=2202141 RepID=UPI000DEC74DD|nr:hypothetical protein [Chromobacterium phragmitis]AXE31579.1 hypothetical protein DK842_17735 [Chromobacterium phragmitis]